MAACGECEVLAGEYAEFGDRLAEFGGISEAHATARRSGAVDCLPGGQHSYILGAGLVPEVVDSIKQMGQWLRQHLG